MVNTFIKSLGLSLCATLVTFSANAADIFDPTPVAQQQQVEQPFGAVDGLNFRLGLLGGAYDRNVLDTASNFMFVASMATPIPFVSENFGMQVDAAAGIYDNDFNS